MIKKRYIISIIIILVLIISGVIISNNYSKSEVCTIDKKCIKIEIAQTEEERTQGLMYREILDNNSGMLFIFTQENIYPFWMKDTLIPLDIIWINNADTIVFIQKNALPCKTEICESYYPNISASYVFEINSGKADELGLKVGDKFDIKI